MRILYLLHAHFELPGAIEHWAFLKSYSQTLVSPYLGEALPDVSSFDLLVVMGGPQSPLDPDLYLKDEIGLIQKALKAHIPVLGFCLGAQLLGEAFGARTKKSPTKEVGVFPIELTYEGTSDPILAGLPHEFLVTHWHNDMPGLTPESIVLAKSPGCPRQIVRYAPYAYGFQCHPEITLPIAQLLVENCPDDLAPGRFIQTSQQFLSEDFGSINGNMHRILNNFLSLIEKMVAKTRETAFSSGDGIADR